MSDYSEVPPFSPLQPESPGIPDLTGPHPAPFAPAPFSAIPIYPQRINYVPFDPALQRPSVPFARTPSQVNRGRPTNALTTPSIQQRADSGPTTGWCRQITEVNTRHKSAPPVVEGALWSLRDRLETPDRLPSPDRSPTPIQNILKTTEAEGDPVDALHRANSENRRKLNHEMDARIALEDKFEKLERRNAWLETSYATYTTALGRLARQRHDARQNQRLAEQRVIRLQGELARSERERRRPDGNDTLQAAGIRDLQDERDGLELERNHYMDLADVRLTENQILQDEVTRLNLLLQAPQAFPDDPPADPAPTASPNYAPPSSSPLAANSPPIKPPPASSHNSPPITAQRHSSTGNDAAPRTNAVRASRGGRGRGSARGRAGRTGRGTGTATREKRERACKVKKNYKV